MKTSRYIQLGYAHTRAPPDDGERRRIAQAVADGIPLCLLRERFGRDLEVMARAAREHGVEAGRLLRKRRRT